VNVDRPAALETGNAIVLTGADLTIADVEAVARHGAHATLDMAARSRMQEARDVIEGLVAAGEVVYGVTTGFGALATTFIDPADSARLQENLLLSHAVGVGPHYPRDVVRAMLLLRANTLALGHSGCRPLVVDRLLQLLDLGIHPVVPEQGSVGASGDRRRSPTWPSRSSAAVTSSCTAAACRPSSRSAKPISSRSSSRPRRGSRCSTGPS
jgi:histidine ammonia-lyase